MQQIAKHFSERLNKILDDIGLPSHTRERASVLGKMLNIPKQQAWSLLEGHLIPDEDLLQHIGNELEVDPIWLLGKPK